MLITGRNTGPAQRDICLPPPVATRNFLAQLTTGDGVGRVPLSRARRVSQRLRLAYNRRSEGEHSRGTTCQDRQVSPLSSPVYRTETGDDRVPGGHVDLPAQP